MALTHPRVPHPHSFLPPPQWMDQVADRLVGVLGTTGCLAAFLVIPPAALLCPPGVQAAVFFLASGWIQLWALSAIIYNQRQADIKRDAKADADHQALTHLAVTTGDTHRIVAVMCDRLGIDPTTGEDRLPRPRH